MNLIKEFNIFDIKKIDIKKEIIKSFPKIFINF